MAKNIIGDFIPNIYINKITLEGGGHVPNITDNPHTKTNDDFMQVYHHAEKQLKSSKTFRVFLNLTIKESKHSDKLSATWYNDVDMHKFFKIRILQSTHPLITKTMLSLQHLAPVFFGMKPLHETGVALGATRATPADILYSVDNGLPNIVKISNYESNQTTVNAKGSYYHNMFKDHTEIRSFNLSSYEVFKPELEEQYKTVLADGTIIYSIPFEMGFDNIPNNTKDLAYFATVALDLSHFEQWFGVDIADKSVPRGKIAAEVVLDDGATGGRGTAFMFADPDGNVWGGPVSKTAQGGFVTGFTPNEKSKPLTKTTIINSKIQDFRNFDTLSKLKINLSVIENKLLVVKAKRSLSSDFLFDIDRKRKYFSKFLVARDTDNNVNFSFCFDALNFVKYNTMFGKLYSKTPNMTKDIIKIRSLKIVRRRIKKDVMWPGQVGTSQYHIPYDTDEPDVVVVSTQDIPSPPFKIKSKKSGVGSINEIRVYGVAENEKRFFTGTDIRFNTLTDGHYQYGVELEIIDNTATFINNIVLENIRRARKNLYLYYYEASDTNKYSYKYGSSRSVMKTGNFDVTSNRFSQAFMDKMKTEWAQGNNWDLNAPWIQAINVYATALRLFIGHRDLDKLSFSIEKILLMHTHPNTGTPRGIMNLIKLMDDLMNMISSLVGVKTKKQLSHGSTQAGDVTGRSTQLRTFKIKHYFEQPVDSNIPRLVGFDYLGIDGVLPPSNSFGLTAMTEGAYLALCQKQWGDMNSQEYLNNPFISELLTKSKNTSFLGVSSVNLGEAIPPTSLINTPLFNLSPDGRGDVNNRAECEVEDAHGRRAVHLNRTLMHVVRINQSKRSKFAGYIPTPAKGQSDLVTGLTDLLSGPMPCPMIGAIDSGLQIGNTSRASGPLPCPMSPSNSNKDPSFNNGTLLGLKDYDQEDRIEFDAFKAPEENYDSIDSSRFSLDVFRRIYFKPGCNSSLNGFNNFLKETALEIKRVTQRAGDERNRNIRTPGARTQDQVQLLRALQQAPPQFVKLVADQIFSGIYTNREENVEVNNKIGLLGDSAFMGKILFEYANTVKVMAMVGFGRGRTGETMLGSMTWQRITPEFLEGIPGNVNILCRLEHYNYGEIMGKPALEAPEPTKLPIYNEYFFIRTTDVNKSAVNTDTIPALIGISNYVNNQIKSLLPSLLPVTEFSTNALVNIQDNIGVGGAVPSSVSAATGPTTNVGGGITGVSGMSSTGGGGGYS